MSNQRPFKAVEYTEGEWGVRFDEGDTQDWAYDSSALTQPQARALAEMCNARWGKDFNFSIIVDLADICILRSENDLSRHFHREALDAKNREIASLTGQVLDLRHRLYTVATNKQAQDSATILHLSATSDSLREQLKHERREREAAQRTIARLGGEQ